MHYKENYAIISLVFNLILPFSVSILCEHFLKNISNVLTISSREYNTLSSECDCFHYLLNIFFPEIFCVMILSEDTPEYIELHHFENVFQGEHSPKPPSNVFHTSYSLKNYTTICLNMDLCPCTRVM